MITAFVFSNQTVKFLFWVLFLNSLLNILKFLKSITYQTFYFPELFSLEAFT